MTSDQVVEILKTSPIVAIVILILWQYRRDFVRIINRADETSQKFMELLERSVIAQEKSTWALESNERATKENTDIIRTLVKVNENKGVQRGGPGKY